MSYIAEEQVWYDGPREPSTKFYGFFLSYGDWDMMVCPFSYEEDRDAVLEYAMGLSELTSNDAHHIAALITAYGESLHNTYLVEATEIAGASPSFDGYAFDKFVEDVRYDIWDK